MLVVFIFIALLLNEEKKKARFILGGLVNACRPLCVMHICWVTTDPIAVCIVFDAGRNVGVAAVGADNIAAKFGLSFDGGND
jgi:hypothetical protein